MLGVEELFNPIIRRCSGIFCCNCRLQGSKDLIQIIEGFKKMPQIVKTVCIQIVKFASKLLHKFLLWGTEDSDLRIEEEVQKSICNQISIYVRYMLRDYTSKNCTIIIKKIIYVFLC